MYEETFTGETVTYQYDAPPIPTKIDTDREGQPSSETYQHGIEHEMDQNLSSRQIPATRPQGIGGPTKLQRFAIAQSEPPERREMISTTKRDRMKAENSTGEFVAEGVTAGGQGGFHRRGAEGVETAQIGQCS